VLMPRSSPRSALRRPAVTGAGPGRYMSNRYEREYAALADQLDAVEHDIHDARRLARRAFRSPMLSFRGRLDASTPSLRGEPVTLADGARILVRPIEPGDAGQLEAGFKDLDAISRYRRFLAPVDHLSERQLTYLTHVDHKSHEALVAVDAATGHGVGVARFVCDTDDPRRADAALVVADRWRGRGVGRALACRLATRARAVGVECFTARMLNTNHAARRLVERVADDIREYEDAGTILFTARPREQIAHVTEPQRVAPRRQRKSLWPAPSRPKHPS
jgi:GNAT superfamily N-acetyltransferase